MKYCGIDLPSNNSVVIVSDDEDRIVLQKRLANDLGQIRGALEPHREELAGLGTDELARGVSPAQDRAGHWRDTGHHDHARDGLHRSLCAGREFQFLLSLRGQLAGKQWQEEG